MHFYKLQGAGNDFVAFDNRDGELSLEYLIRISPQLCNRRLGIGADGVMALFPATHPSDAYTMVYRNADGSDAGMCGNGGRCIARLAVELGITQNHSFRVHDVVYHAQVHPHSVKLAFPAEPVVTEISDDDFGIIYQLFTGTDHIVVLVSEEMLANKELLRQKGRQLRYDKRLAPRGTNVNFIAEGSDNTLHLVTYERGVEDLTLACGTGSLAAAIIREHNHKTTSVDNVVQVAVHNTGGVLTASFTPASGRYKNLSLEGPAEIVFEGDTRV